MFECAAPVQVNTVRVNTVRVWTGRESEALRHALHLSMAEFAQLVGVSRRTVAYWRQRGSEMQLRWEVQRLLDAMLGRADPLVSARFQQEIAEEDAMLAEYQEARYRKVLGIVD